MLRRLSIVLVSITLLSVTSFQHLGAENKLTVRDIRDLLGKYFAKDATENDRSVILASLQSGERKVIATQVESYINNDVQRPAALDLAVKLRLPGLLKCVTKYIDSDDVDRVVELLFITSDKDSLKYLFTQWEKNPTDSLLYILVSEGFQSHSVEILLIADDFLAFLKKADKDEVRSEAVLKILKFQMCFAESSAEEVVQNWKTIRAQFEKLGKHFKIIGRDALQEKGWTFKGVSKIGANYRMPEACGLVWDVPESWRAKDYSLKFWLLAFDKPVEGGFELFLSTATFDDTKTDGFGYKEGKWEKSDGLKDYAIAMKDGEWTQVEVKFANAKDASKKERTLYEVLIGGKSLFQGQQATGPGPLHRLTFSGGHVTDGGISGMMVGGIEIVLASGK